MSQNTVQITRRDGTRHETLFEGYGGEHCADKWYRDNAMRTDTLVAIHFQDGTIRASQSNLDGELA